MKKTRNLIIMVVIFLVLIAGFALWKISSNNKGQNSLESSTTTSTSNDKQAVVDLELEKVKSIELNNDSGRLLLEKNVVEQKDDDGELKKVNNWTLNNARFKNLDQNKINNLANKLIKINSVKELDFKSNSDLNKYGLEKSYIKLIYNLADGSKQELLVGNNAKASGENHYYAFNKTTEKLALIMADDTNILINDLQLIDTKIFNFEYSDVKTIDLQRSKDDYALSFTGDKVLDNDGKVINVKWEIQEPIKWPGYDGTINTMLKQILEMEADEYFEIKDDTELASYGLDTPQYKLKLTIPDADSRTLLVGGSANDLNYGMFENSNLVFAFKSSSLNKIGASFLGFFNPFIGLTNVEDVEKLNVETPNNKLESLIYYPSNDEIAKAEKENFERPNVIYTLNGKDANVKNEQDASLFSRYYQSIISPRIAGLELDSKFDNSKVDYRIKFKMRNKDMEDKLVEYVYRDEFTYYALINGEYTGFYVKKSDFIEDENVMAPSLENAIVQLQSAIEEQKTQDIDEKKFEQMKKWIPANGKKDNE